ncbi:hypothetical protein PV336_15950 [Streptomyces sp. MI02-2A]|uniref:hypothetical protein n=1 Tax=Streptomyces sp. MI02-2A TaxID=3028688 RepID=UPI0029B7C456|nr:hypothetical protein [Streptomyces sp. MI02-2A]MDX3260713.1 hypothetical protein [Streptomyces sp. MI02-2A]
MDNVLPTDPKPLGVLMDETPAAQLVSLWDRLRAQVGNWAEANDMWQAAVPYSVAHRVGRSLNGH